MVNLVKIEKGRTAFFKDRELVVAVGEGLEPEVMEFYRTNHEQLEIDSGKVPEVFEMATIEVRRLEELVENSIFLNEHVLRGSSRADWLAKSAEDILA